MNIQEYIRPELLILVPVCWGIGLMLKSTPLNNQWIPLILALCSILLSGLYVYAFEDWTLSTGIWVGVTQGMLCWVASWLSYEKVIKPKQ